MTFQTKVNYIQTVLPDLEVLCSNKTSSELKLVRCILSDVGPTDKPQVITKQQLLDEAEREATGEAASYRYARDTMIRYLRNIPADVLFIMVAMMAMSRETMIGENGPAKIEDPEMWLGEKQASLRDMGVCVKVDDCINVIMDKSPRVCHHLKRSLAILAAQE